jgi:N-acetylglucosamine-6-phosphate deacetylase
MSLTIAASRLLTGTADLAPGWVRLAGEVITELGAGDPPGRPDLRLVDGLLVPGLVDAQVNGAFGIDLAAADAAAWRTVAQRLPETGVTAFAPTVITAPVPELAEALREYARLRPELDQLPAAARTLGMHVEGPFLSARRRGAHRPELLVDPVAGAVDALLEAGRDGALLYITLAPEREGAVEAIRRFTAAGVRVAVGHSDAAAETVHAAAAAGAQLVTHLFNGQRPMHHRDPGVVGAALADARLTCGLIADGQHVAGDAIAVAFAAAPGRIMLVSDAVAALGMPAGRYQLGGVQLTVQDGQPPRRADGTIAGAAGPLDEGIAIATEAGVGLQQAVEAATRVPADVLGRGDLGRIAPGARADLVWLAASGDCQLRARATWVGGRLAHGSPGQ